MLLGIGFTEDGGNLLPVIDRYVTKKGVFADQLATYLPDIGKGTLAADKEFHELLKRAGKHGPLMAEAQNEQFNKSYLDPAFDWFKKHGFDLPLSFLVIADSRAQEKANDIVMRMLVAVNPLHPFSCGVKAS